MSSGERRCRGFGTRRLLTLCYTDDDSVRQFIFYERFGSSVPHCVAHDADDDAAPDRFVCKTGQIML